MYSDEELRLTSTDEEGTYNTIHDLREDKSGSRSNSRGKITHKRKKAKKSRRSERRSTSESSTENSGKRKRVDLERQVSQKVQAV